MHGFLNLVIVGGVMVGAAACERGTSAPPARPAPLSAQTMERHETSPSRMSQRDMAQPQRMQPSRPLEMCPMDVEGVRVNVTDIGDGIALVFTTMTGDVADLRGRVRLLAEAHAQKGGFVADNELLMSRGAMYRDMKHGDMKHGDTSQADMSQADMSAGIIPSDVMTVDIDNGVRLEFRPELPAQIADLRQHAQLHAQRLARGQCPRELDIEARR